MNKLPSTRLDDRLNAVLIAIAAATLLVLTLDAARDDKAHAAAVNRQAGTTAPTPTAPAATTTSAVTRVATAR